MIVLDAAGEIGVSRARSGNRPLGLGGGSFHGHFLRPHGPIAILHLKGDGGTQGFSETDAGKDLHLVFLDDHPPSSTVTLLPSGELTFDGLGRNGNAGGHAFENGR